MSRPSVARLAPALLLAFSLLAAAPPPRRATPRTAPHVPAPTSVVRSADGRWLAANWRMHQEGWGQCLLFDRGELVRVLPGMFALQFASDGGRMLVVDVVPDDENDYWLLDLTTAAEDVDLRELPKQWVLRATGASFESWTGSRLVFRDEYAGGARDTVDLDARP